MAVMNGKYVYRDLVESLRMFVKDFGEDMTAETGFTIRPVDYDMVASEKQLPLANTFGISNLSFETDGQIIEFDVLFGITTWDDVSGENLHKLCSLLFDRLLPDKTIAYKNADTAVKTGLLNIRAGTRAMPVTLGVENTRPTRFFAISGYSAETIHR